MYYALAPSISIKEAQTNYLYTFIRGGHFIAVTHTTLGKFFFLILKISFNMQSGDFPAGPVAKI